MMQQRCTIHNLAGKPVLVCHGETSAVVTRLLPNEAVGLTLSYSKSMNFEISVGLDSLTVDSSGAAEIDVIMSGSIESFIGSPAFSEQFTGQFRQVIGVNNRCDSSLNIALEPWGHEKDLDANLTMAVAVQMNGDTHMEIENRDGGIALVCQGNSIADFLE